MNKKLLKYLNEWADYHKYEQCSEDGYMTLFGSGYKTAISDVYDFIFDKRTICAKCLWISPLTKIRIKKCPNCGNKSIVFIKRRRR